MESGSDLPLAPFPFFILVNDGRPTHIDLFSGIGGFSLAAESVGWRTVVFCEKDKYCRKVLGQHWPSIPVVEDIRDFDPSLYRGASLLTGGFPCQPFSHANGKRRKGTDDDRFLWPEMRRVIKGVRPDYILAENVVGIIQMALDQVLSELETDGYTAGAVILPACAVNAPHRRDRVWILANSNKPGPQGLRGLDSVGEREDKQFVGEGSKTLKEGWESESTFCRVAHGIPRKIHRITALGNSIVPQVAREILRCLVRSHG
tara:strand:- start:268 stop:1047 length:780 start_codon:yes stop_codon:yes gene_type:complete